MPVRPSKACLYVLEHITYHGDTFGLNDMQISIAQHLKSRKLLIQDGVDWHRVHDQDANGFSIVTLRTQRSYVLRHHRRISDDFIDMLNREWPEKLYKIMKQAQSKAHDLNYKDTDDWLLSYVTMFLAEEAFYQ